MANELQSLKPIPDVVLNCMELFKRMKPQFAEVLPKHLTPERFVRLLRAMMAKRTKLASCRLESLVGAVVECSILGLEPETPLGYAWILPYGQNAQLIIGWKGYVQLVLKSGNAVILPPEIVYSRDHFEEHGGTRNEIIHRKAPEPRGEPIGVYCIARVRGIDEPIWRYLDKNRVMWHKSFSAAVKGGASSPWNDPKLELEMWRKSAVRELIPFLPLSIESQLGKAVEYENRSEAMGEPLYSIDMVDAEKVALDQQGGDLKQRLADAQATEPGQPAEPPTDTILRRRTRVLEVFQALSGPLQEAFLKQFGNGMGIEFLDGVSQAEIFNRMELWMVDQRRRDELPAKPKKTKAAQQPLITEQQGHEWAKQ